MSYMCKYCKNFEVDYSKLKIDDIFITTTAKYTFVGDGKEYYIPLNFCPNCGRELKRT